MINPFIVLPALFIAHWYLALSAQSIFHHRYAAHGMFKLSPGKEKLFYVYSYLVMGPSYLSAYVYGILHRLHHMYADKEGDPHSPTKYFDERWGLFKMMWDTAKIYSAIDQNEYGLPNESIRKNLPEWYWFDRWLASSWFSRLFWAFLYTYFYVHMLESQPWPYWFLYLLLPLHFFMNPIHGAIINWYGHTTGVRRYNTDDTSTNLPSIIPSVIMPGEGYHNNHHAQPANPNFAHSKKEFDLYYWIMLALGFQIKKQ